MFKGFEVSSTSQEGVIGLTSLGCIKGPRYKTEGDLEKRFFYMCHPGLDPGPDECVPKPNQLHMLDLSSLAICDKLGPVFGFNLSQNVPSAGRQL